MRRAPIELKLWEHISKLFDFILSRKSNFRWFSDNSHPNTLEIYQWTIFFSLLDLQWRSSSSFEMWLHAIWHMQRSVFPVCFWCVQKNFLAATRKTQFMNFLFWTVHQWFAIIGCGATSSLFECCVDVAFHLLLFWWSRNQSIQWFNKCFLSQRLAVVAIGSEKVFANVDFRCSAIHLHQWIWQSRMHSWNFQKGTIFRKLFRNQSHWKSKIIFFSLDCKCWFFLFHHASTSEQLKLRPVNMLRKVISAMEFYS